MESSLYAGWAESVAIFSSAFQYLNERRIPWVICQYSVGEKHNKGFRDSEFQAQWIQHVFSKKLKPNGQIFMKFLTNEIVFMKITTIGGIHKLRLQEEAGR